MGGREKTSFNFSSVKLKFSLSFLKISKIALLLKIEKASTSLCLAVFKLDGIECLRPENWPFYLFPLVMSKELMLFRFNNKSLTVQIPEL